MLQSFFLLAVMQGAPPPSLTVSEIVDRLVRADNDRLAALSGYTGMRRYRFENKRFKKRAEMTVRVSCGSTGVKTFDVVSESGSSFVRGRVIRKMIDAEREAGEKGEHEQTRIIPKNYDFHLRGVDNSGGRASYVLEVVPKTKNRFLIQGCIWVACRRLCDHTDRGKSREESVVLDQQCSSGPPLQPLGAILAAGLQSLSCGREGLGVTEVSIDYFDYVLKDKRPQASQTTAEVRVP